MKPPSILLLLTGVLASAVGQAEARTWTDATGRYTIQGDFEKLEKGTVNIRRDDGKLVRIPLEKLSEADRQHVRTLTTSAEESPFAVAPEQHMPADKTNTSDGEKDVQTVIAEGVGLSRDEALKDAFRAAVQQVVGTVVDAETLVKNDELIKDQVLTYSDAYVPQHKIVGERQEAGLVRMKIQATVKRRSLVMKLKAANITTKAIAGQSMFGDIVSELDAEQNARALVEKALEGFPLNCLTAEVVDKPELVERDSDKATIRILMSFQADLEAYDAFCKRLENALDGVALEKGEFSLTAGPAEQDRNTKIPPTMAKACEKTAVLLGTRNLADEWWQGILPRVHRKDWRKGALAIAVNDSRNQAMDRTEWKYYVVDGTCREVLAAVSSCVMEVKLSLLDNQGELVTVDRFPLLTEVPGVFQEGPYFSFVNSAEGTYGFNGSGYVDEPLKEFNGPGFQPVIFKHLMGRDHHRISDDRLYLMGPFFVPSCNYKGGPFFYVPHLHVGRDMTVTLEELKRMATIKCELRYNGDLPPKNPE